MGIALGIDLPSAMTEYMEVQSIFHQPLLGSVSEPESVKEVVVASICVCTKTFFLSNKVSTSPDSQAQACL